MPDEKPKHEAENKAGEPGASYSKKIRFYSTFEEMNEADYKVRAETAPIDHLRNTIQLIIRTY